MPSRRGRVAAHPYSLASAEVQRAYLHQYRGEPAETLRWAGRGPADRDRARLPFRAAQAAILRGWALADRRPPPSCGSPGRAGRLPGHRGRAGGPLLPRDAGRGRGRTAGDGGAGRRRRGDQLVGTGTAVLLPARAPPPPWRPAGRDRRPAAQAAEAYGRAMEIAAGYGTRSAELRVAICCAACRPVDARGRCAPPCGGSTTSSTRGSAPPTCWPAGPCSAPVSRPGLAAAGVPGPR